MSRKRVQLNITTDSYHDPADAISVACEQAGSEFRLLTARVYRDIDGAFTCTATFDKIDSDGGAA